MNDQALQKAREIVADEYDRQDMAQTGSWVRQGLMDDSISVQSALRAIQSEQERQEGELEALREYAREATKAITSLTAGGSEYFGKRIGDIYTADLPFCLERIKASKQALHKQLTAALEKSASDEPVSECLWVDKPCTCGGGACEQVDFGDRDAPALSEVRP
jgi:hypothetical protein